MAQASRNTKKKPASRRRRPVPGWLWFLSGMAICLSFTLFTFLKDRSAAPPPPVVSTPQAITPKSDSAKTENDKNTKPKFDFYTILPEMEVIVPDKRNKAGQSAPIDKPGIYILQVASFRSFAEADNLKARLALLGVESKIETVTVNNSDTWHRLRVGPTQDLRELNKIRTRLLNNNINPILLRVHG